METVTVRMVTIVFLFWGMTGPAYSAKTGHLEVGNSDDGSWGDWSNCSPGQFVSSVKTKTLEDQGFFRDDSALNALELRCSDGRVLKSAEGSKGTWSTPISVPKGLKEVTMRDGSEGGHGAASIKFKDCTGTEIKPGEQFDDTWGEYLDWKSCPENTVIAGFRSKVFDGSFFRGSSGVNKIEFHCSQLDEISHCNGNGELWTIAADFISKVQNGQFESRKIKFETFASLSPAIKKIVILELNVDEAEEIVNNAPAFDFDKEIAMNLFILKDNEPANLK